MTKKHPLTWLKNSGHRIFKSSSSLAGKILLPICRKNDKAMSIVDRLHKTMDSIMRPQIDSSALKPNNTFTGERGVNVAGYINAESGVGEAARANIRALEKVGIPFSLNNISSPSRQGDTTHTNIVKKNPYVFKLIHANPDNFNALLGDRGVQYFKNKYNIGFWYWELSKLPKEWFDCFKYLDEIWVATSFCHDSVSMASPVPVVKIPPSVVVDKIKDVDRSHYGLKKDSFIFFFMFDFLSYLERKNPLALINAFKSAFSPDEDAVLLLKCSNSENNREGRDRILEAAKGLNVKFIDQYFDKDEIHALVSLCDCYVSLHRSEGFGLPLAEAMYLKKPVIATGYSGNTEFMNGKNSFLVDYKLIEIDKDYGPYKRGNVWADPDVGQAAELMRLVYEKRDLAKNIGEIASRDIKVNFNPEVTGKKILERLECIAQNKQLFGGRFL